MKATSRYSVIWGITLLFTTACTGSADRAEAVPDTLGLPISSAIALRPQAGLRDVEAERARDPQLAHQVIGDSVRLEVLVQSGDQINALQPPVLTYDDGRRLEFGGPAITSDSAYFIGAVTATVPQSALPMRGRLVTSYCRAGEKLCRSSTRDVVIE